ncbi:MAG: helix-turn-helix domain-containing protein [Phocaeicola sp.]
MAILNTQSKKKEEVVLEYNFELVYLHGNELLNKPFMGIDMVILKCTKGSGTILLNSEKHTFCAGSNFLLSDIIMLKFLECSDDFTMMRLTFSPHYLNEIYPILDIKVYEVIEYSAPDWYSQEEARMSDLMIEQLVILHQQEEHSFRKKLVKNLVINYIYEIYDRTLPYIQQIEKRPREKQSYLINEFYGLLSKDGLQHRDITYYAEKLHITPRYLHKICKDSVQMTPKQCIDYVVLGHAKKLLLTTELNSQQIADTLHFSDQSAFGQFFKRQVGLSPLEFRRLYK